MICSLQVVPPQDVLAIESGKSNNQPYWLGTIHVPGWVVSAAHRTAVLSVVIELLQYADEDEQVELPHQPTVVIASVRVAEIHVPGCAESAAHRAAELSVEIKLLQYPTLDSVAVSTKR